MDPSLLLHLNIPHPLTLMILCSSHYINYINNINYKKVDSLEGVSVHLDSDDTTRYTLTKINNVQIGPSPFWLKNFLAKMNMTSINNIVDASNFFMLHTGHPIHVFDFDQLDGKKISVTTSAKGEVDTLSNESKKVDNHLVISDDTGPIALAGIIGCKRGSVNSETKNILIECASFNPSKVRASSKLLNISTESSYRFERHVSEYSVSQALSYAAILPKARPEIQDGYSSSETGSVGRSQRAAEKPT